MQPNHPLSRPGRNEPVGTTTVASPFKVNRPPDGYRLVQAGKGTRSQNWGSDTFGTEEPFTLLAPGSRVGSNRTVTVLVFGFGGYPGGLFQGSSGYQSRMR